MAGGFLGPMATALKREATWGWGLGTGLCWEMNRRCSRSPRPGRPTGVSALGVNVTAMQV